MSDLVLESVTVRRSLADASDGLELGREGSKILLTAASIAGVFVFMLVVVVLLVTFDLPVFMKVAAGLSFFTSGSPVLVAQVRKLMHLRRLRG